MRSAAGSCIAVRLLASVNGGDAGSGRSANATRITAPIRRGHSGSGQPITAITGASGEPRIPSTPSATAWRSVGAMASSRRHVLHVWTAPRMQEENENSDGKVDCDHVSGLCDAATCPLAQMGSAIHTQTKMRL